MKKFLVLGLILAVAGGAFAQSLDFSGSAEAGFAILFGDDQGDDAAFVFDGYGASLGVSFENADGTGGVNLGVDLNDDGTVTRGDANAWILLADGMVNLVGGFGGPGGFSTAGGIDASFDIGGGDAHVSAIFDLNSVVDGLTAGLTIRPAGGFAESVYALGVGYVFPDVANFTLIFQTEDSQIDLGFGVDLTLPVIFDVGLTKAGIDAVFTDLGGANAIALGETFGYELDDLSAYLTFKQFLGGDDATLLFLGGVSYGLDIGTASLDFGFGVNSGIGGSGDGPGDLAEEGGNMVLAINPSFSFSGLGGDISIGYVLGFDLDASTNYNKIYFNFGVSF